MLKGKYHRITAFKGNIKADVQLNAAAKYLSIQF